MITAVSAGDSTGAGHAELTARSSVCKDCYSHYITSKIIDEGESRRIQCMGSKCNVIVDEKTVELLVSRDVLDR